MSYSIFYRAMFIKLSDGTYIPMIESGDNNVWEADNRRRARDWSACRWMHESDEQRRRIALTEGEIVGSALREIDRIRERYVGEEPAFGGPKYTEENVMKRFSYFSCVHVSGHSTSSAKTFLNFIKSGFRNAVTMDELREWGCSVRLGWWEQDKYQCDYAQDEKELLDKWNMYLAKGITPYVCLSSHNGEYAWTMVKTRNVKPRKERRKPTEYYVIRFTLACCDRFLVKLTSRNLLYNPYSEYAHKYASRKVAENAAASIGRRFSQISNIRVEQVAA